MIERTQRAIEFPHPVKVCGTTTSTTVCEHIFEGEIIPIERPIQANTNARSEEVSLKTTSELIPSERLLEDMAAYYYQCYLSLAGDDTALSWLASSGGRLFTILTVSTLTLITLLRRSIMYRGSSDHSLGSLTIPVSLSFFN